MTPKLHRLRAALNKAERNLREELERAYRVGVDLRVKIQRNHRTATHVRVVGHLPGGRLRVQVLDSRNGGGFVTTVNFEQIVEGGTT
jgi:hypothetical protein